MSQDFRETLFKRIRSKNRIIYLFRTFEHFTHRKPIFGWITAYKNMKREQFIVESGAGITQKRAEKQIRDYIKERFL